MPNLAQNYLEKRRKGESISLKERQAFLDNKRFLDSMRLDKIAETANGYLKCGPADFEMADGRWTDKYSKLISHVYFGSGFYGIIEHDPVKGKRGTVFKKETGELFSEV
ncbi:MAG: hypothetical protein KKF67_01715 [Nanoarchaeota archaeon]|nr:hypothetical protein [Nanoarchaeota archaeon]